MCFHCICLTLINIFEGWVKIISNRHYATNAVSRPSLASYLTQNVPSTLYLKHMCFPSFLTSTVLLYRPFKGRFIVRAISSVFEGALKEMTPTEARTHVRSHVLSYLTSSWALNFWPLHFQGQQISALVHWPSGTQALFFCCTNVDTSIEL